MPVFRVKTILFNLVVGFSKCDIMSTYKTFHILEN